MNKQEREHKVGRGLWRVGKDLGAKERGVGMYMLKYYIYIYKISKELTNMK